MTTATTKRPSVSDDEFIEAAMQIRGIVTDWQQGNRLNKRSLVVWEGACATVKQWMKQEGIADGVRFSEIVAHITPEGREALRHA